jgi:hypothetical protein
MMAIVVDDDETPLAKHWLKCSYQSTAVRCTGPERLKMCLFEGIIPYLLL